MGLSFGRSCDADVSFKYGQPLLSYSLYHEQVGSLYQTSSSAKGSSSDEGADALICGYYNESLWSYLALCLLSKAVVVVSYPLRSMVLGLSNSVRYGLMGEVFNPDEKVVVWFLDSHATIASVGLSF